MVPVPYSPVTDSTPKTPMANVPRASPAMAWLVGSKPWNHWGLWWPTPWVARTVTPIVPWVTTATAEFPETGPEAGYSIETVSPLISEEIVPPTKETWLSTA